MYSLARRYPADIPYAFSYIDGCMPPVFLQILENVTQVPIFPKGSAGFDGLSGILPMLLYFLLFINTVFNTGKLFSTVTVTYDSANRLIMFSPRRTTKVGAKGLRFLHEELAGALGDVTGALPPRSAAEAAVLSSTGRPAVVHPL